MNALRVMMSLLVVAGGGAGCGSRSSVFYPRGHDGRRAQDPDGPAPRPDRRAPPPGWAALPAGTFTMGSPPGEPCREAGGTRETQHQVTLTVGILMATTEVTQSQYRALLGLNPAKHLACGESCPVEQVTWHEAAAYCNALSSLEGLSTCYDCAGAGTGTSCSERPEHSGRIHLCGGYRLPTEAEWEYAYRAGTTTAFYSGPIGPSCETDPAADSIGWYLGNAGGATHPVGQKTPNAWGLHDLAGNVWEWCHDLYQDDLGSAPVTDPQGAVAGQSRILRGSSWVDAAGHLRAADRFGYPPASRNSNIGFRCVRQD